MLRVGLGKAARGPRHGMLRVGLEKAARGPRKGCAWASERLRVGHCAKGCAWATARWPPEGRLGEQLRRSCTRASRLAEQLNSILTLASASSATEAPSPETNWPQAPCSCCCQGEARQGHLVPRRGWFAWGWFAQPLAGGGAASPETRVLRAREGGLVPWREGGPAGEAGCVGGVGAGGPGANQGDLLRALYFGGGRTRRGWGRSCRRYTTSSPSSRAGLQHSLLGTGVGGGYGGTLPLALRPSQPMCLYIAVCSLALVDTPVKRCYCAKLSLLC